MGKAKRNSPLGRARRRGNDSIKTHVNDIKPKNGEWTDLVQLRVKWRDVVINNWAP